MSFSFTITGEGNIRTLPEPKVVFPTDFEAYPPKITESIERKESALTGSKTYEDVLDPRAAGVQKIKPVILSVFEPATKRYRKLQTEEFVITVEKGEETFSGIPSGLSKEEVKLLGQDIRFIKTETPAFKKIGDRFYKHLLFWIIMLGPLVAVAVSLGYRKHLDKLQGDLAYARDRRASRVSKKHLSSAKALQKSSTQKAFYAAIGKALMGYLGDKLNLPEAGIILDEVEKLLRKKGVSEDTIHAYFECLHICDMKRFSPSEATKIEMEETFQKVEKAINGLDKELN